MPDYLTVDDIRRMIREFKEMPPRTNFSLPMRVDLALSRDGDMVVIPGHGVMHPQTFIDIAGESAYQELLKRPRVDKP